MIPIHFLALDRQGNKAVFECLDGKMRVYTGETLPQPVLANSTYEKSLNHLNNYRGFGGDRDLPWGSYGSLERFACAAEKLKQYASVSDLPAKLAFSILRTVAQGDWTKWSIVHDVKNNAIYYRTLPRPEIKKVDLNLCDFDPNTPVQVININSNHSGILNPYFHDYCADENRWLIEYAFNHSPAFSGILRGVLAILAEYPDDPDRNVMLSLLKVLAAQAPAIIPDEDRPAANTMLADHYDAEAQSAVAASAGAKEYVYPTRWEIAGS